MNALQLLNTCLNTRLDNSQKQIQDVNTITVQINSPTAYRPKLPLGVASCYEGRRMDVIGDGNSSNGVKVCSLQAKGTI